MSFKENLRSEISYQDIKIKKLAESINVSYSTFLKYVNSTSSIPNCEVAVKIAKRLNVSVEYLVTGSDTELKMMRKKRIEKEFTEIRPVVEQLLELSPPTFLMIKKIINDFYKIEIQLKRVK